MTNALELLMFLVFFAPIGVMVAMNLAMYREGRYVAQPPAPMLAETAAQTAQEASNDYELRKAA